ncbi:MAG: diguanylate cyclase [Anaerolineae bacterium]
MRKLQFFWRRPDSLRRLIYIAGTLAGLPTIAMVWFYHWPENLFVRLAYPLLFFAAIFWLVGLLLPRFSVVSIERFVLVFLSLFLSSKYVFFLYTSPNLEAIWTEIEAIFWVTVFLFIISYLVFHRYVALSVTFGYAAFLAVVGGTRLGSTQHPLFLEFVRLEARLTAIAFLLFIFARAKDDLHASQQEAMQVRWLANTDALTQLPNRRHLSALLEHFLIDEKGFGYILVDIDFFKQVNDTFGHVSGDEILRELSELLRSELRDEDVVGRWGGEEFLILVKEEDTNKNVSLSNRIRQLIENHVFSNGISLTVSIGGTMRDQRDTEKALFDRADAALYRAKNAGRNRVEWQP